MATCPYCGKTLVKVSYGYRHRRGQGNGCLGASQYNRSNQAKTSYKIEPKSTLKGCGISFAGLIIFALITIFGGSNSRSEKVKVTAIVPTITIATAMSTLISKTIVVAKPSATMFKLISQSTPNATLTPRKQSTLVPFTLTSKPEPTSTPKLPVLTRTPVALNNLSYQEIEDKYDVLSSSDWQNYRDSLIGKKVHWSGAIKTISTSYLTVNLGQRYPYHWIYLDDISNIKIKAFKEGQHVEFEGTIYKFQWFLGLDIHLQNVKFVD